MKYLAAAAAGAAAASVIARRLNGGRAASDGIAAADRLSAAQTEEAVDLNRAVAAGRAGLYSTVAAVFAAAGAAMMALRHDNIAAGILLLVSMVLSGLVVRGPRLTGGRPVTAVAGLLFLSVTIVSAAAIAGYQQVRDPDQLLLLAVFSVCALAALFMVAVSWLPGWHYREPAVLALLTLTLTLGGLSLHGLTLVTSALTIPSTNGFVLFYADQPSGQPFYLNVGVSPSTGPGIATDEFIEIVNPSSDRPASWAVLLTGDARLTGISTGSAPPHEQVIAGRKITWGALAVAPPGQLFWGRLQPGTSQQISGQPAVSYVSRDATQTAVSLPDFDLGSVLNTDPATLSAITRDLGTPGTSPGGLSIAVDAGSVSPLDTVVTAITPLANPSKSSWTFRTETAPAYKLLDQSAQDSLNSYSFALAVLLGAAGAGLLASIQALVGTATTRKEQTPS